jgi:hypothetical protein
MPRSFGVTNSAPYASAPAVGAAGDMYWNSTEKILYVSNGTAWIRTPSGLPAPTAGDVNKVVTVGAGPTLVYTKRTAVWG